MRQPASRTQLSLRALRGLAIGAATGLVIAFAMVSGLTEGDGDPHDGPSDPARPAIKEHHCSTEGFGASTVPSSALIRMPEGDLAFVSFDRGWSVHQADGAARLVAVCLDAPPER